VGYKRGVEKTCLLCEQISIGRGLCRRHYNQHRTAGTLGQFAKVTPLESFLNRIEKTDGCWLWRGTTNNGYGIFLLPGEVPVRAHRHAYELWKGPIPDGAVVMHVCDNPPCVNPDHLQIGTRLDNNRDCAAKGRRPTGANHWKFKLTAQHVVAIRNDTRTMAAIAIEYGTTASTVSRIKNGKRRFAKA
jgi:hypothetical protein